MQDAHNTTEALTHAAQATSDAAMAKFGFGVGVSGGSTMVISGLSMNEFGIIFGMIVGLIGVVIQWYYKHKQTSAEIRVMNARDQREAEEHRARMGMY